MACAQKTLTGAGGQRARPNQARAGHGGREQAKKANPKRREPARSHREGQPQGNPPHGPMDRGGKGGRGGASGSQREGGGEEARKEAQEAANREKPEAFSAKKSYQKKVGDQAHHIMRKCQFTQTNSEAATTSGVRCLKCTRKRKGASELALQQLRHVTC